MWSPAGGELFFRTGDAMMAVLVQEEAAISFGSPERLFEGTFGRDRNGAAYDVTRDGQRFVMVPLDSTAATAQIHVILSWTEELNRLVPASHEGS